MQVGKENMQVVNVQNVVVDYEKQYANEYGEELEVHQQNVYFLEGS